MLFCLTFWFGLFLHFVVGFILVLFVSASKKYFFLHDMFVLSVFGTFCAGVAVCVCVCLLMSFLIHFVVMRVGFLSFMVPCLCIRLLYLCLGYVFFCCLVIMSLCVVLIFFRYLCVFEVDDLRVLVFSRF